MTLVKFKYAFLLTLLFFPSISSWSMESQDDFVSSAQSMPFRLGFEFQESNHLCPWAKPGQNIQKEPLFFMDDVTLDRQLWKVVIDGQDIEFVLEPFSHTEYDLLEKSINSVLIACQSLIQRDFNESDLEKALKTAKISSLIGRNNFEINIGAGLRQSITFSNSFEVWKEWLKTHVNYQNVNDSDFQILWNKEVKAPIQPSQIFGLVKINPRDPITFKNWISEIKSNIDSKKLSIRENEQFFAIIENREINKPPSLKFQPQATIQYPLEYSIPLFFSLFEFQVESPSIVNMLHSLPFLDEIKESGMERYFTKKAGLIFLHALTLSGITSKNTDINLLYEIQRRHEYTGQVDAKGTLNFMSRRPFSDMWRNVKEENDDFWEIYSNSMKKNKIFVGKLFKPLNDKEIEWVNNIHPNYAEEIFSQERPLDLSVLLDCFTTDFLILCNQAINNPLSSLLTKGILTTTMIRNFDPEKVEVTSLSELKRTPQQIFESYHAQAVQSVQDPRLSYKFDLENKKICEVPYPYDTLSPPLFLSDKDAMGLLKQEEELAIQNYGEAIIEIRNIKNTLSSGNNFLTQGDETLLISARKLFSFLEKINKEEVLSNNFRNAMLSCIPHKKEN